MIYAYGMVILGVVLGLVLANDILEVINEKSNRTIIRMGIDSDNRINTARDSREIRAD